jgi:hypothetical protein
VGSACHSRPRDRRNGSRISRRNICARGPRARGARGYGCHFHWPPPYRSAAARR